MSSANEDAPREIAKTVSRILRVAAQEIAKSGKVYVADVAILSTAVGVKVFRSLGFQDVRDVGVECLAFTQERWREFEAGQTNFTDGVKASRRIPADPDSFGHTVLLVNSLLIDFGIRSVNLNDDLSKWPIHLEVPLVDGQGSNDEVVADLAVVDVDAVIYYRPNHDNYYRNSPFWSDHLVDAVLQTLAVRDRAFLDAIDPARPEIS